MADQNRPRPFMPLIGSGGHGWGQNFAISREKPQHFRATLMRLMTYLLPYKWALTFVMLSSIIGTLFSIFGPRIMGIITTQLYQGFCIKCTVYPESILWSLNIGCLFYPPSMLSARYSTIFPGI